MSGGFGIGGCLEKLRYALDGVKSNSDGVSLLPLQNVRLATIHAGERIIRGGSFEKGESCLQSRWHVIEHGR